MARMKTMMRMMIRPLCPAGHLSHKGRDRLVANASSIIGMGSAPLVISPPVGEVPGREEGGFAHTAAAVFRSKVGAP